MPSALWPSTPLHVVENAPQRVIRTRARGSERCQCHGRGDLRGTSLPSRYKAHSGMVRKSVLFTGMPLMVHQGVRVEGSTVHEAKTSQKSHSRRIHCGHSSTLSGRIEAIERLALAKIQVLQPLGAVAYAERAASY